VTEAGIGLLFGDRSRKSFFERDDMSTISGDVLLEQLNWRYATKKFDATKKIPAEQWSQLEQALILSASSYGLQPWTFVVVNDPATRAKLKPLSWNQSQVTDASHLVVFAVRKNLGVEHIDKHLQRIAEVRGQTVESLKDLRARLVGDIVEGPRSLIVNQWAQRQLYIALGTFLTSAALLGIDACPMEGFEADKYDAELGLNKLGLASTVMVTAGYRAADDSYAKAKKVRFTADEVILRK
jgi:nitroreductase